MKTRYYYFIVYNDDKDGVDPAIGLCPFNHAQSVTVIRKDGEQFKAWGFVGEYTAFNSEGWLQCQREELGVKVR